MSNSYPNVYFDQKLYEETMAVYRKQEMDRISVETEEQKAMRRADVASRRELQKTDISIKKGQPPRISKQLFGGKCYDEAEFSVLEYCLVACMGRGVAQILYVKFGVSDHREKNVYFWLEDLEDREINRKLNTAGINFGFAYTKETSMRRLLISKLIQTAPTCYIPPNHGWYENGAETKFSYPNEVVWEVVMTYV